MKDLCLAVQVLGYAAPNIKVRYSDIDFPIVGRAIFYFLSLKLD
jgi:hypothetical protein